MATPLSAFSNVAENETGPRKTVGATGGKTGKPKFALQDRSNVTLKKTSTRIGTPVKAFGGGGGGLSLALSSKGNRQENQHRNAKPNKLFDRSKSFSGIDQDTAKYANDLSKDLNTKQEITVDVVRVDENDEAFPAPEEMQIPLESDIDYYSSIPSPTDKLLASQVIHEDYLKEGHSGPSDEVQNHLLDETVDDPSRCMSPVAVLPIRHMAFGIHVVENDSGSETNF